MANYVIYTDGSVYPSSPGWGGWAAVLLSEETGKRNILEGSIDYLVANPEVEMLAALYALQNIPASEVVLYSDSLNLIDFFTENRYALWERRGWKRKKGTDIQYRDIWEELVEESERHENIEWKWIKSHDGNGNNDLCDQKAYLQALKSFERNVLWRKT